MSKITASIITIGDELLIGQVIDTNSAWVGQELTKIGIQIQRRVAVGDLWDDIWQALKEEEAKSDIIIITGGLGPTNDDITKELLCAYFGGRLVIDEAVLQNVQNIFAKYNRPLLKSNYEQAQVPDVCTVMQNVRGTAPGMIFKRNKKLFFSMPGVPFEMKAMTSHYVVPEIQKSFTLSPILHRTLVLCGIGESFLAERLKAFETQLPTNIKLAYLPGATLVRLRLTERRSGKELTHIEAYFTQLQALVADVLVTNEDVRMQEVIAQLLLQKGKTVATAESCTGGYIAHLLTSMPGASKYFYGSIVSYDNSIKENSLHVKKETLKAFGAVSEEVVKEMALAVREIMHTDYALAVSGILGPDGGSEEKPAGTVWVAVANGITTKTKRFSFRYDRTRNMEATAINAFNLLKQLMLEEN